MARLQISKENLNAAIAKVLAGGNPYKANAVEFFIDQRQMFIYANEVMTAEQLDKAYVKTAEHDIVMGYKDRMVGYYDKWYRYNHADEGRAYDEGVKLAVASGKCEQGFHIIECMA